MNAAGPWIKCSERLPTEDERKNLRILWDTRDGCFEGENYQYNGKWLRLMGKRWSIDLPLYDCFFWAEINEADKEQAL